MGTRLERIPHSKFLEELTRPGIELLWKYYLDRNVVITLHVTLERLHSLAAQAKPSPILCARRQGHSDLAINRWDINFGT
jgi:outer membrane scaffolding protein for murein synthesis (MipA/OmpV family)